MNKSMLELVRMLSGAVSGDVTLCPSEYVVLCFGSRMHKAAIELSKHGMVTVRMHNEYCVRVQWAYQKEVSK